jgi:hypothetical protein
MPDSAVLLLGLLFGHEDGGDLLTRNICPFMSDGRTVHSHVKSEEGNIFQTTDPFFF